MKVILSDVQANQLGQNIAKTNAINQELGIAREQQNVIMSIILDAHKIDPKKVLKSALNGKELTVTLLPKKGRKPENNESKP